MAGVKFTREGAERIVAAVRFIEGMPRSEGDQRYLYEGGPGRDRWYQLAWNLDAGGATVANPVRWSKSAGDGGGDYTVDTSTIVTVRDTTGQAWGLRYEWVLCRSLGASNEVAREVVLGGASWHKAILEETLVQGGSATATVMIRGHQVPVIVWDAFLSPGDSLEPGYSGMTIGIEYEAEDRKWYVTEAPCP